jgi:hypothetical protein
MTLAELIVAEVPSLADAIALELATVTARRAEAQAIIDAGTVASRFGADAIEQAAAYLDGDPAAQARDGVAHLLLNQLRADRPGAPITRTKAVKKIDLLSAIEGMFAADVAWRAAAANAPELAAALGYWDRIDAINACDPLCVLILDALEAATICTPALRAALEAACTEEVPGPMTTALREAGLDTVTLDDVRAALEAVSNG